MAPEVAAQFQAAHGQANVGQTHVPLPLATAKEPESCRCFEVQWRRSSSSRKTRPSSRIRTSPPVPFSGRSPIAWLYVPTGSDGASPEQQKRNTGEQRERVERPSPQGRRPPGHSWTLPIATSARRRSISSCPRAARDDRPFKIVAQSFGPSEPVPPPCDIPLSSSILVEYLDFSSSVSASSWAFSVHLRALSSSPFMK